MAASNKAACSLARSCKLLASIEVQEDDDRDWSKLPDDLIAAFARGLHCNVDRAAMELQCRAWRDGARLVPWPEKHLPWLLVPYRRTCFLQDAAIRKGHFFCILSARSHTVPIPSRAYGARFIGSLDGGWVLIATVHNCGYAVVNFRTGISVPVSESVVWGGVPVSELMVLRAAAFSCPPSDSQNCVIASIVSTFERKFVTRNLICFTRLGGSVHGCATLVDVEDVIYFEGAFHCLTKSEDLMVCVPAFDPLGCVNSLTVEKTYHHFVPLHHDDSMFIKSRYLVQSRGELLMVVRFKSLRSDATCSMSLFRIDKNDGYYAWKGLASLQGRIIFLAKGGSKCYDVADYTHSHEGVYFLDDDTFRQPSMVAFGHSDGRQYNCHDNGFWAGPGMGIKRWYDWRVPSTYTPPVWFLQ